MKPGALDLSFTQGDDYSLAITFKDNANPPQVIDYSGSTFAAQVRETAEAPRYESFTVDGSQLATGILTISLDKLQTRTLPERCAWDLEQTDGSGNVTTYLAGAVTVKRDVTRVP